MSFVNEVRENAFLPHSNDFVTFLKNDNSNLILPQHELKTESDRADNVTPKVGVDVGRTSINGSLFKRLSDNVNVAVNNESSPTLTKKSGSLLQIGSVGKIAPLIADIKNSTKRSTFISGIPSSSSPRFNGSMLNGNISNTNLEIFNKTGFYLL